MSTHSNTSGHHEASGHPTKGSQQLLWTLLFSLVIPVIVIVALVRAADFGNQPDTEAAHSELAVMQRIQKVGSVVIGSARHETQTGEQVFKAQCTNCHTAGVVGAPKFGDAAAWAPRIKTGFAALLNSALKGKNAMPPQGGGAFDDFEVARAVVYMANAGGAKFPEPVNSKKK